MLDKKTPPTELTAMPALATADCDTPWIPLGKGRAFKPIRFMQQDRGYVALMRVEPGTAIPPHRHTGEVHAYNLAGHRELCSGELIGPGDYVYEPPWNVDTWKAIGDEPVIVLITVFGAVEYLNTDGSVAKCFSSKTQEALYRQYCEEHDFPIKNLSDQTQ